MSVVFPKDFDGEIMITQIKNEEFVKLHSHDFLELVYVVSGNATHEMNGIQSKLSQGDYFVVDYGAEHTYFSKNKDLNIINCLFLPEIFDKSFSDVTNFNDLAERYFFRVSKRKIKGPASNQVFSHNKDVGILIQKMLNEYNNKQEGYIEIIKNTLCEIIIKTVRQIGSRIALSNVSAYILEHIQNEYMTPINLKELCEEMNFSLPYISAKFKEETGYTFTTFLQNKRIEEACRLLRETQLSVSLVAEKTGYTNIKFFNKVFRKVTKTSPLKYRKENS